MIALPPRLDNAAIQRWVDETKKAGGLERATANMKATLVAQTKNPNPNYEFQSIIVENANRIFRTLIIAKSHSLEGFDDAP
jgi:hypothetical protein